MLSALVNATRHRSALASPFALYRAHPPPRLAATDIGRFEDVANLLIELQPHSSNFSKYTLTAQANQSDFDSAIPWFESRRPSQLKL
jgi:hypothetical protein